MPPESRFPDRTPKKISPSFFNLRSKLCNFAEIALKNQYFFETDMAQQQSLTKETIKTSYRIPDMYRVIMHNDDVTTMEFVIFVLQTVFRKTPEAAIELMLEVHTKGAAIVGVYPLDIALSKIRTTERYAAEDGFPLRLTTEKD